MDYNEEKARELIEKYRLSPSTLNVWKCRGKIPDKYLREDYQPTEAVTRADAIRLSRLQDINKTELLNFTAIAEVCGIPQQQLADALRRKARISSEEIDKVETEIKKIRALIHNNIQFNNPAKLKKIFNCPEIKFYKVCGKDNWAKSMYYNLSKENQLSKNDYEQLKDYYFRALIQTSI